MKPFVFLLPIVLIGCLSNCKVLRAKRLEADLIQPHTQSMQACCTGDSIQIQYIGCGGFLIRHANEAVLIDPYFSNAPVVKKPAFHLKTDTALVDSFFKSNFNKAKDTEGVIQTVLISHAHHDHLADLPDIYRRNLKQDKVTIIGSETVANIFKSFQLPFNRARQMVCFDSIFKKDKLATPSVYSPNRRMRITAILTEHAPHFLFLKAPFLGGSIRSVPKKPPTRTFGFKEGLNYNFMIDFLDDEAKVIFRIFSNAGAASDAPIGFPPPSVLAEKKVDIQLICGASYNTVKAYPEKMIAYICPEKIFVAHWEDFFTPIPELLKQPRVVPLTNILKFLKIIKKAMVKNGIEPKPIIVQPLTSMVFKF